MLNNASWETSFYHHDDFPFPIMIIIDHHVHQQEEEEQQQQQETLNTMTTTSQHICVARVGLASNQWVFDVS